MMAKLSSFRRNRPMFFGLLQLMSSVLEMLAQRRSGDSSSAELFPEVTGFVELADLSFDSLSVISLSGENRIETDSFSRKVFLFLLLQISDSRITQLSMSSVEKKTTHKSDRYFKYPGRIHKTSYGKFVRFL